MLSFACTFQVCCPFVRKRFYAIVVIIIEIASRFDLLFLINFRLMFCLWLEKKGSWKYLKEKFIIKWMLIVCGFFASYKMIRKKCITRFDWKNKASNVNVIKWKKKKKKHKNWSTLCRRWLIDSIFKNIEFDIKLSPSNASKEIW